MAKSHALLPLFPRSRSPIEEASLLCSRLTSAKNQDREANSNLPPSLRLQFIRAQSAKGQKDVSSNGFSTLCRFWNHTLDCQLNSA